MSEPGDKAPFGGGFEQIGTNVDPPMALRDDAPETAAGEGRSLEAYVEVVLCPWVGDRPAPGAGQAPWHYVQLWTAQRIYAFDLAMTCVAVVDRAGGGPVEEQLVGASLTGGQLTQGGNVKMVYPLPVPGTQAVLETKPVAGKASFVRTPPLERVLVRLVAVGATPRDTHPTWESVSSWQSESRDTKPPWR
jgi:hypothetical protein